MTLKSPSPNSSKTVTVLAALHFLRQLGRKLYQSVSKTVSGKQGLTWVYLFEFSLEVTGNDTSLDCSSPEITEEEFDHFFTMDNNIDCYGNLTDEEIISDIGGDSTSTDIAEEKSEDQDLQVPRSSDVMQALSTIQYFLDAKGLVQVLEGFYPIEEQVWKVMATSRSRQKVLIEFFKP